MSKRKDALEALLAPVRASGSPAAERRPGATPGSLKVMGLALQSLNEDAEQAETLRAQLVAGDRVVELDPALVDRSPFQDRLESDADPDFESLKASIAESQQQVPILVRPHPDENGRYQAAYGHRRLKAAQALGRPVRAVVRSLTDAELVVAQGKENLERRDLSFIERAQFAATLEARGFDRATLLAAVEPNKGNLSVMLSIAKAIPPDVVAAIGPAPKVGRPRWSELAELLQGEGAVDQARAVTHSSQFQGTSTDRRFNLVLAGLQAPRAAIVPPGRPLTTDAGRPIGRVERGARSARLTLDDLAFADFLVDQLLLLHAEFERSRETLETSKGGISARKRKA